MPVTELGRCCPDVTWGMGFTASRRAQALAPSNVRRMKIKFSEESFGSHTQVLAFFMFSLGSLKPFIKRQSVYSLY